MTATSLVPEARQFSRAAREALEQDLMQCRAVVSASGSSFYYAFYLLPPAKRDALCAVYAFCRAADDIADAAGVTDPAARLEAWRQEVERAYEGEPRHAIGRALAWAIDSFALPKEPFLSLIDGVSSDLQRTRYATQDELELYCYCVASTVGLLCVRIFGAGRGFADEYAIALGKAFQLTNILRDIGEDGERGRIYLPLEDLERVGCTEEMILEGRPCAEVERLVAFEVAQAKEYYSRARAALPQDPALARALAPAEAMNRIYESLLVKVEHAGARVLENRVRVSAGHRAWLVGCAWASGAQVR